MNVANFVGFSVVDVVDVATEHPANEECRFFAFIEEEMSGGGAGAQGTER